MLDIRIASYRRAVKRLERGEHFDAIVSITTTQEPHKSVISDDTTILQGFQHKLLLLRFYDVLPHRKAWKGLPTGNHVLDTIKFARSLPDESKVLVHCAAGRSRSTATGIIMHAATGQSPKSSVDAVFQVAARSNPNGWLLRLADIILYTDYQTDGLFEYCKTAHQVKW